MSEIIYNICSLPVCCRVFGPSADVFVQRMTRVREKVHPVEDLVIGNIEACKHPNWLLCVLWVKACSVSHRHFEELFGYLHHVFHDNLWHAMVHYLISTKNIQSVRNQGKFICFWQFGWYMFLTVRLKLKCYGRSITECWNWNGMVDLLRNARSTRVGDGGIYCKKGWDRQGRIYLPLAWSSFT